MSECECSFSRTSGFLVLCDEHWLAFEKHDDGTVIAGLIGMAKELAAT